MDAAENWDAYATNFARELTGCLRAKLEQIAQASWDYNWLPSMTADVVLLLPEIAAIAMETATAAETGNTDSVAKP